MGYVRRWQEEVIDDYLQIFRVVMLSGARQVGKTTLAKAVAGENATYVTLDDSQALQTAQADPQQFLCHDRELMIIDEIQKLPQLISAIKIAVDVNNRRGQFILTGSADILSLPTTRESLAGRAGYVQLSPMSQGEIEGKKPRFLHYLRARGFPFLQSNGSRMEIITRAFRGGYPEAIQMPPHARRIWHEDYVRARIENDLQDFADIRKHEKLQNLVRMAAAWSGQLCNDSSMAKDLAIGYNTLRNYLDYLRLLYIIDELEPYSPSDIKTIGKTRKLFFADTGMMEAVLRKDERAVYGDPRRVGSLLETFVHNELMAHIHAFREGQWRLYHYRDGRQREIDFVLEDWEGNLYAIEVKSGVNVGTEDARHLVWFEENVAKGRPFFPAILHTGSRRYTLGNVHAVPMAFLWE